MAGDLDGVAGDIVAAMDAAGKALRRATREAMKAAGGVAVDELDKTAPIVPGPDRAFSNWPSAGPLKVKTDLRTPGSVRVIPVGPWGVAEQGAAPHAPNHPGTRATQGKAAWSRGQAAAFERLGITVPEDIARAVEAAMEAS